MEIRSGAGEQALKETEVRRRVVVTATDGEVACAADRIGEAEALALTASLYAATQQLRGRTPRTTNDLLADVVAESLLPPGLSLTDGDGAIASAHASLFVRYRVAARETVAEVAYRESAERLAYYNERGDSLPLAIESIDGRLSVHRLKDTKPRSLVERALRPLIEKPAARETRQAIETASAHSRARLITENEKSRAYLEAAREIAGNLRAEAREQGIDISRLVPEFTPKERINLEIYAERQTEPTERERYLGLARGEVAGATPLHETQVGRFAHDHASQVGYTRTPAQSHDYDSHARSTGRAG